MRNYGSKKARVGIVRVDGHPCDCGGCVRRESVRDGSKKAVRQKAKKAIQTEVEAI